MTGNFSYFFARNYDLTENDQRLNLDTSYGVYMDSMFYECDNLTTVPNFNTINVMRKYTYNNLIEVYLYYGKNG